ncbi:MAG: thioredoxin family protein [Puniceicoccaceae bacterium]
MNLIIRSSILLFLVFLSAGLFASDVRINGAEVGQWTMDYDAAKELAAKKNLPLMLNFTGSDWCIWCKRMDAQVFAKDAWKKYAEKEVVLVTLDFPRDKSIVPEELRKRNEALGQQFGIQGYPTYVVLDSDGATRLGQLGAGTDKTPESFIQELQELLKLSTPYLEALTKKDPAKAEAIKAAIAELRAARKELDDWIATRPQRTPENEKLFEGFLKKIEAADKALSAF